jgi:hypothetical protein
MQRNFRNETFAMGNGEKPLLMTLRYGKEEDKKSGEPFCFQGL